MTSPEVPRVVRWALLPLLLIGAQALAGERVALLVGSNDGLSEDPPLRHTGDDLQRLSTVLTELGGFATQDVHRLEEANAAEVERAVEALSREKNGMFVFYFWLFA